MPTSRYPRPELMAYRTYGGWSVQRPEFGTLGRYSPDMTRLLGDGRTFELRLRLDRAAYDLHREAGVDHETALHHALLCPSWAGLHNAPAFGLWEMELKAPATDRVEMVAMLWPESDEEWPVGEINLMEGRVGSGRTMTNLHWADPDTSRPAHDPEVIPVDVSQWHRYRVEVLPDAVRWSIDGALVRELRTEHSPYTVPVHMVVQAGVNRAFLRDWHPDIEWEERILFRPLRAPQDSRDGMGRRARPSGDS
ncbi:glycoside hydrolase family 16 protein [Arachnia propionica]|uniref:Glycosyl hydrolase family protein n=1 Tax=Arachnia propionica TaxID=1750 RepID=A0A3P1WXK9_9ACTN|nr:glycoside hydrolase family 16 protein [Arachnia propionica]RRD51394.1 glycosyl hydrolase family protein [Arachnia propionica]